MTRTRHPGFRGFHSNDRRPSGPQRSRGQVLVIFALTIVVFIGLSAVVVDVAWYWANSLKMQRAADAAALAGVVRLPGDEPGAIVLAENEAAKNGYVTGVNGYVVDAGQDATNPRQMDVRISGPVSTYFARALGLASFPATRASKAEYVLPVPMGSPEAWYGVGFFAGLDTTSSSSPADTGWLAPGGVPSTVWSNATLANALDDDSYAVSGTAAGSAQQWNTFNLTSGGTAIPSGATIDGIEVRTRAVLTGSDNPTTTCRLLVALSWNNGGSWTNGTVATPALTSTEAVYTLGSINDLSVWGSSHTTWTQGEFTNGNFRLRLTWDKPSCGTNRTASVDTLEVRVHSHTTTTTTTQEVLSVPNPNGGTLPSQGFWGAVFTPGGVRENGDRYAPAHIGAGNPPDGTNGGPNPDYDPDGYDYTIEVGAGGQVRLFDPVFCATGPSGSGGWLGAGDHWTTDGTGGSTTIGPVAVRYRLYDTNGTLYDTLNDTQVGNDLTYDPGSANLGDFSGDFGTPQNASSSGRQDCASNPAHNHWVLPTGWSGLPAGTYRLNVNTNLGAENANLGAENLFSVWVDGSGRARVYGGGRMAAYTNLDDTGSHGAQKFFFSQIEGIHAGKTMVITLFDPGEASSPSYLRFLSPQGCSYHYATMDWRSNDGRSGTSVTEIQTSDGNALFNNKILTIEIALPTDYGSGCLDPDGLGEAGWWKVEYDVRAGNDTTTWQVDIRGNPVHLIVP